MPIVDNATTIDVAVPFFSEMKKQAFSFLKEKLNSARLALTDVTSIELMTEEATNGNPGAPDARTMRLISKAAFEVGDYWRIVGVLHKRLANFDPKNWRHSYQALVILEHLLTHGPESVCREFQSDKETMKECGKFQYIDERGFNWGLSVRKKSERILKFLDEGQLLKEERERTRKLTQDIQGFGSFSFMYSNSASQSHDESNGMSFRRCNSEFIDYTQERQNSVSSSIDSSFMERSKSRSSSEFSGADSGSSSPASFVKSNEKSGLLLSEQTEESNFHVKMNQKVEVSSKYLIADKHDEWDPRREAHPLLRSPPEGENSLDSSLPAGNFHPFTYLEAQSEDDLLSERIQ